MSFNLNANSPRQISCMPWHRRVHTEMFVSAWVIAFHLSARLPLSQVIKYLRLQADWHQTNGWYACFHPRESGPLFNIKMSSYQYRKSHCGDKTVVRSSYLHNGISYTGKMSSLYWNGAQGPFQYKDRISLYRVSILKRRQSWDRLIVMMEIAIFARQCFYIDTSQLFYLTVLWNSTVSLTLHL